MPIKELPSDTPLDSPTSKVTELPSGTQLDAGKPFTASGKPPQPRTTASGLIGSVERGIAPYVAGAGLGAAAGAPFAGVGAVPGAAAGVGAVALTDLATHLYNPIAHATGLPTLATPQELTDKALDYLGVKRPSTAAERVAETTAAGFGGGAAGAKAAERIAEQAAKPVVKAVAEKLAAKPVAQAISSGSGAAAGQEVKEQGGSPFKQWLASLVAGGVTPATLSTARRILPGEPTVAAMRARDAGYKLPPASISKEPDIPSSAVAGLSGKIKTQQAASAANEVVTNKLANKALGLPQDTVLNSQVFDDIRTRAGQNWSKAATAVPTITTDAAFNRAVTNLQSASSQAQQLFPDIVKNPYIDTLIQSLQKQQSFPTKVGFEIVKTLRHDANQNFKAFGDPQKTALAFAQRQAADAVEELIERNMTAAGNPTAVADIRQARKLIAMSYDVEAATNTETGDVSARALLALQNKGRPLSGELETIANIAAAFPKAVQPTARFGGDEPWSALDAAGAIILGHTVHPAAVATIAARPLARAGILSEPYQNYLTGQNWLGRQVQRLPAAPGAAPLPLPTLLPGGPQAAGNLFPDFDPVYRAIVGNRYGQQQQ